MARKNCSTLKLSQQFKLEFNYYQTSPNNVVFHKQCFNVDMMWKDMLEKKRIVPIDWLNLDEFR